MMAVVRHVERPTEILACLIAMITKTAIIEVGSFPGVQLSTKSNRGVVQDVDIPRGAGTALCRLTVNPPTAVPRLVLSSQQ